MSLKLIILITYSNFLRVSAEEYLLIPPNHRSNDDQVPYNLFYYIPTIANTMKEQPKEVRMQNNNNNMRMRQPLLSRYMKPPDPRATSNYSDFHGQVKSQINDQAVPYNHKPFPTSINKMRHNEKPTYTREHDPFVQTAKSENEKSQETKIERKKKSKKKTSESLELSPNGDRIEFQIQGHEGPSTYIFGYDTGDGKNRQFRLEEKLKDGSIKGHYGYYDARGKLRTVRYLARPAEGYKEKHHESNKASMEEE